MDRHTRVGDPVYTEPVRPKGIQGSTYWTYNMEKPIRRVYQLGVRMNVSRRFRDIEIQLTPVIEEALKCPTRWT